MDHSDGPDFLVVGAQKCGTTWLHRNLSAHPGAWLPPEKELHFFDERMDARTGPLSRALGRDDVAIRWRRQVRRQLRLLREDPSRRALASWYASYFLGAWDLDWYRGLFRPGPDQVAGEVTPDYSIVDRDRVEEVQRAFPGLRLVLLVRHPVERIWSHAQMQERLGGGSAERIAVEMLGRGRPRAYTDYQGQLERWAGVFGDDRVLLGFMEDIAMHPRAVLNTVTDHLGLARHTRYPAAGRQVHKGGVDVIPAAVAARLAAGLREEIDHLATEVGGHARWWAWSAERLVEGGADGELAYPLWDSTLFEEYEAEVGEVATAFATDRYDAVRAAARSAQG
jgi:hypothetical protein